MTEPSYIFIVGSARSGTTWLRRAIAAHPQVAGLEHELTLFSRYLGVVFRNYDNEARMIMEGRWKQGLPLVMEREELVGLARSGISNIYSRVLKNNPSATHVLDKHPNYSNHMALIKELCPNARFIHMIRDGRQVVLSMMSVNRQKGHSAGEIRQATRDWYSFVENARHSGAQFGEDYFELRYEDLLQRGAELLTDIFMFCGLEYKNGLATTILDELNKSAAPTSPGHVSGTIGRTDWAQKMSLEERFIFDRMAGGLLTELGYAKTGWWFNNIFERARMEMGIPLVKLKRATSAAYQQLRAPIENDLSNGK